MEACYVLSVVLLRLKSTSPLTSIVLSDPAATQFTSETPKGFRGLKQFNTIIQ